MKTLFNSILDAILGFNEILRDINKLEESNLLKKYYKKHFLEAEIDEEKSILQFDAQALLKKVLLYKNKLEEYSKNYEFYDKTNTIQERDLKYTTNNFFLEVIKPIRDKTIEALKQLKVMIKETKDTHDKELLNSVTIQIIQETNNLIDVCIIILKFEKKIIKDLEKKNINFKEKYELIHISWEEI